MTAAWLWARSELRSRWRSWIVLGLLAGSTFGLAAAGLAGARRTSVALPRYLAALHAPTAAALVNDPAFDAAERRAVAALPEVSAVYPFEIAIALQASPVNDASALIPTTAASERLLSGVLVAGGLPDPKRPDEIVVDQNMRRQFHLSLGSTMTLSQRISAPAEKSIPPGMLAHGVDPDFSQKLRVVGIEKSVDSSLNWSPSSGFYTAYGPRIAGFINEFTTLYRGEADLPRFRRDMQRIVGHPVNVESFADIVGLQKLERILRVEEDGLLLFALAVLLVGGVLVGQALARAVSGAAAELATWRALGADRGIAVGALVIPAAVSAVVGIMTSIGVAIALSPRFPISDARRYDLHVGTHADWLVLGLTAGAITIALLATAALTALWVAAGRDSTTRSPSRVGDLANRAGLPPALAIGSRLAVEPGRGRRAVPVRSALIGAVVGVLGVVGCFTFRAGLTEAAVIPQRSGIVWNFEVASGEGSIAPKIVTDILRDPAVSGAIRATWFRAVQVNGVSTPTFGINTLKGGVAPVVLTGRAPRTDDEIAFGPGTLHDLHLHVGQHITVGAGRGHRATVVGTALLPATSHTDYDQSAWMTTAGLHAALPPGTPDPNDFEDYLLVSWAPGTHVSAAQHHLESLGADNADYYTSPVVLPTSVVSLGELRTLPLALGVFFALLASATVAHALVTTVRRRRRELAVLRSIGFTRRQARIAIGWQATLIAIAGLVVGVPFGVLAGRLTWRRLADSFPVAYVPPLALLAVLLVIPIAVFLANVLAAGPAHTAARIHPAEALRAE